MICRSGAHRMRVHRESVSVVRRMLRKAGVPFVEVRRAAYSFVLDDGRRVAVRVSSTTQRKRTYHAVTGEWRHYSYATWVWNLHQHGRAVRGVDVWVLVGLRRGADPVWVIAPAGRVGRNLSAQAWLLRTGALGSRWRTYESAWQHVDERMVPTEWSRVA